MKSVKIPLHILSIEGDGYHLLLRVKINGKKANCILDTGASKSVFDSERIKRFVKHEAFHENERLSTGLGTASMQSQVLIISKLELGTYTIKKLPSIVLDLSHINQTYSSIGFEPIDGVIGSDILVDAKGIIDYGKNTLTLFPPKVVKAKPARKITAKKSLKKPKSVARKSAAKGTQKMRSTLVAAASRKTVKGRPRQKA
ncbi:MAG: aspartyl protease family protein [Bacteroidia bacterium]